MRNLLIILLFFCLTTQARTLYLSPNGSDLNLATLENPCFSLNSVWSWVQAGDTIAMRGGTYKYNAEQLLINRSGTYGKPIVIMNYGNEKPVITKETVAKWVYYSGILVMADHIVIRGLKITGWKQETSDHLYYGLIAENCHYLSIEQCSIHDNGFGLVIGDWSTNYSDHIKISNCDLYNNSDPLTSYGTNTPWGGADGLRIGTQDPNAVINITGCRMWGNSDDGVDTYNCNSYLIFTECWSFQNGYRPDGSAGGNGIGFKLGPSVTPYPSEIKRKLDRCLAAFNRSIGFDQNTGVMRMQLVNLTAWGNARGFMFNYSLADKLQHIAINCLSGGNTFGSAPLAQFSPQSAILNCSFIPAGWQCIDNPLYPATVNDLVSTDCAQLRRPRINGIGLPIISAFNLKYTSLLIDSGFETSLPWAGQLPDIGCFESYE